MNNDSLLLSAQNLSKELIRNGHVDAEEDAYDGVRALFQCLHALPVTGFSCAAIRRIESDARKDAI